MSPMTITRPDWLHRMTRRETRANVRAMAILSLAAGALWLYTAAVPVSPNADTAASLVDGALAIAAGALCWALASRFRVWMLHLALTASIASATVSLVEATTPLGAALVMSTLLWTCVYVGAVYEPPTARVYAACGSMAVGVGLLFSAVADPGGLWFPFAATCAVTIELLSRMTSRLRAEALTDPLTGLLNRKGFVEASQRAISICRRAGGTLTVAHIDLDGFKQVNDRQGHRQGDRLLMLCANSWRAEIRAADILARIGGDEFVLVLPGSDRSTADRLLTRLRAQSPTAWSYGIAELKPGDDIETCLARADTELYAAKAQLTRPTCQPSPSRPHTRAAATATPRLLSPGLR